MRSDAGNENEEWREVIGYADPQLLVSNQGRLAYATAAGLKLKSSLTTPTGYRQTSIRFAKGVHKKVKVHRIVLETFAGPQPSSAYVCRHLDGNRMNNAASNLRWGTVLENAADREAHGRTLRGNTHPLTGVKPPRSKFVKQTKIDTVADNVLRLHADGFSQREIARSVGLHQATVWRFLNGRTDSPITRKQI